jgi:DNA-binding CsgD family transcriptional regulator
MDYNKLDWDEVFVAAALQPDRWPEALDLMARETGSSHGQLIGIGEGRAVEFNLATNFEPWAFEKFVEMGGGSPTTNFRIAASERQIERGYYDPLLYERHYDEAISQLTSRRYVDWCDEIDVPFGCQTNLVLDDAGLIGLATLRKRSEGRTKPAQRHVFAKAAEAARRAVRLQERLEGEQARFLAGAYEAIGVCAFILDFKGRLIAHTATADVLLSRGDIRLAGSVLDAEAAPMSLRRAIDALTRPDGLKTLCIRIHRSSSQAALVVDGFRLPRRSWSLGRLPHAVLVANAPRRDRVGALQLVRTLYGLTAAEADIALRLFQGKSRVNVASERGVTAETLRGQIKDLHAKCGVAGEADLMRLLASIF